MTTSSTMTPVTPCPSGSYCDLSYSNGGNDAFVACFNYRQISGGVNDGTAATRFFGITTMPNPTDGAMRVRFVSQRAEEIIMVLADQLGRAVWSNKIKSLPGENTIGANIGHLPSGIYYLKLSNGSVSESTKVSKL